MIYLVPSPLAVPIDHLFAQSGKLLFNVKFFNKKTVKISDKIKLYKFFYF